MHTASPTLPTERDIYKQCMTFGEEEDGRKNWREGEKNSEGDGGVGHLASRQGVGVR